MTNVNTKVQGAISIGIAMGITIQLVENGRFCDKRFKRDEFRTGFLVTLESDLLRRSVTDCDIYNML
jgi:hypothetical protein